MGDVGIFSDLDAKLRVSLPPTLEHPHAFVDRQRARLLLYDGAWPVKAYALGGSARLELGATRLDLRPDAARELARLLTAERLTMLEARDEVPSGDLDRDGIPDPLDVALGALKTALNADRYDGRYQQIAYPDGDVDRAIGVCTDVIVRALRNAGFDLQRAVHEDIARAPAAYPMVKRANASIDHRRVKSLLPYFQRHFSALDPRLDNPADPLRPGDILLMDTFPDRPGPEHVGMVADSFAPNGLPLVINNWTNGTRTQAMELLSWVPVTHRFRLPAKASGPIPASTTQLLVVVADGWNARHAQLTRYTREPGKPWRKVGAPMRALLGHTGLGWGDGLHASLGRRGPVKREGDGRSPAGVFALGTLRGTATRAETRLAYAPIDADQVCVDDPASRSYNLTVSRSASHAESAEPMLRKDGMYELALDVMHNRTPVTPGHGSCIFLHIAPSEAQLTGCTGLSREDMLALTRWLAPGAILVALPSSEYRALRSSWSLP